MGQAAKSYIYGVIATGGFVLAYALANWSSQDLGLWAVYTILAVLASTVKLRLPGMEGTYSLSFLFLLYGVAHFSPAETLIAGCAAAVAQSVLNTKKRSTAIQMLFNVANLAISVGACFVIARVWLGAGMAHYLPAVMALVACCYFVVNTVIVSGVLSLLQNKSLGEVFGAWYVWSFPYYLIGVVLAGLAPAPGYSVPGEAWLILLPLLYLVHFFFGLIKWQSTLPAIGQQPNAPLPKAAQVFVAGVAAVYLVMMGAVAVGWQSENPVRFVIYLTLAALAATLKIQLPGMRGTMSPAFVLVLSAVTQMSFAETVAMASAVGLVQVLWRSTRSPMAAQVLFNPACLAVSAGFAWGMTRVVLEPWLNHSVAGELAVGAVLLFSANTLMVSTVMALVDRRPMGSVLQLCYFWSLPYYLVGGAVAGLMTAVSRTTDWGTSLLILPVVALVYISYRAQLSMASARCDQTA